MVESEGIDAPRRRAWWRWLALLVAAMVVIGAGLWFAGPFGAKAAAPVTAIASTGSIVSSVDVSGAIAAASVEELSFGASGTVQGVAVTVGAQVAAGQVLATIDATAANAQLAVAQANLAAAQARLTADQAGPTAPTVAAARDSISQASQQLADARQDLTDTQAGNAQTLAAAQAAVGAAEAKLTADQQAVPPAPVAQLATDASAVSQAEQALSAAEVRAATALHQAQQQVSSASLGVTSAQDQYALKTAATPAAQIASDQATVAQARSALVTATQTAGGAEIVSPIAGTVTAVQISVGQQVGGGSGGGAATGAASGGSSSTSSASGQIEVMDLGHLVLGGQVSDVDVAKLKVGQGATITADALGSTTLTGSVCEIDQVGTQIQGVASYGVQVCLNGTDPGLRVGMSADAAVVVQRAEGVVLVPSLAVQTRGGQQIVEVLGADGKTTTATPVQTGLSDGQDTQIVSGLSDGARVVISLPTTTSAGGGRNGGGGLPRVFGGFGG